MCQLDISWRNKALLYVQIEHSTGMSQDLRKVDTHYTSPVVWPLLAIFFSICIYAFSGADKKDTGAEKV